MSDGIRENGGEMRERFEEWFETNFGAGIPLTRIPDGRYELAFPQDMWFAWQAALASQPSTREASGELMAVLEQARKFIVVACGDYAPYVKVQLGLIDAALASAQPALSEGQVTELANTAIDRAWQRVKGLGGAPSIADWRIVISEAIRAASQSPAPLSEGQVREAPISDPLRAPLAKLIIELNDYASKKDGLGSASLLQALVNAERALFATQPAAPQAPVLGTCEEVQRPHENRLGCRGWQPVS